MRYRARIAAEEKRVKFEQMQLAAGAAVVEEKKFAELRSGAEREMTAGQTTRLAAQQLAADTRSKAQQVRMTNGRAEKREKRDFLRDYDSRVRPAGIRDALPRRFVTGCRLWSRWREGRGAMECLTSRGGRGGNLSDGVEMRSEPAGGAALRPSRS